MLLTLLVLAYLNLLQSMLLNRLLNLPLVFVNLVPLSARLMLNLPALQKKAAVLLTELGRRMINGG
jgi:hypothetical protein